MKLYCFAESPWGASNRNVRPASEVAEGAAGAALPEETVNFTV
jgi:hypothetical protein